MSLRTVFVQVPYFLVASVAVLGAGCGSDLSDQDFGGVDLLPFFFDSTADQPGPPEAYTPQDGFLDGNLVRYLDFGWSAAVRDTPDEARRNQLGLERGDTIPKVAPINPMYFFFDSKGNPMFSAPVKEKKTGAFSMRGGSGVRNENPSESAVKSVAYSVRARDLLVDPLRKTADYQRPIIDVVFDREKDEALQKYSGLWEFVSVKAPSGYQPDEIKSWATLEKGVTSGDFVLTTSELPDLLAINCPIIDSRSVVVPHYSVYDDPSVRPDAGRVPQPRVELWYRRKRIDCFLVNGWETLGKTVATPGSDDQYVLYKQSEVNGRFSVFDTDISILGTGASQKRQLVGPLGQVFIPRLSAKDADFYVANTAVTTGAFPRRTKSDPTGYRPVRWWWNVDISDFGRDFSAKTLIDSKMSDVRNIDDSKLSPREGVTVNFPLISRKIPCDGKDAANDPCAKLGLICGLLAGTETKFCETPVVRYGETCGPAVAQCRTGLDQSDVVEKWLVNGVGIPQDLTNVKEKGVPDEWLNLQANNKAQGRRIIERTGGLYSCLEDRVTKFGTCYLTCAGGKANYLQNRFLEENLTLDDGRVVRAKLPLDSRCGGELMPGFRCLPVTDSVNDKGGSRCLRDCNAGEGAEYNRALCRRPTPTYFSDSLVGFDAAKNTSCVSNNVPDPADPTRVGTSFGACILDESFAPFPKE